MGDIGEYYQEQRERMRPIKEKALKDNTALLILHCEINDFKFKQHSEFHISIYHPERGRFDYWPSTGKGGWFDKKSNKMYGRPSYINDIEDYLNKHFR